VRAGQGHKTARADASSYEKQRKNCDEGAKGQQVVDHGNEKMSYIDKGRDPTFLRERRIGSWQPVPAKRLESTVKQSPRYCPSHQKTCWAALEGWILNDIKPAFSKEATFTLRKEELRASYKEKNAELMTKEETGSQ